MFLRGLVRLSESKTSYYFHYYHRKELGRFRLASYSHERIITIFLDYLKTILEIHVRITELKATFNPVIEKTATNFK